MARQDFLANIMDEAERLHERQADSRIARVLTALVEFKQPTLQQFCERLLDRLIEITGAERGFVLFYLPETTEADIIAARHFQTTKLSLGEYRFSRSLLGEVFQRNEPLLIEDASKDPNSSATRSVVELEIKSVLAVPLKQDDRTIGAVYLENNKLDFCGQRSLVSSSGF
jgi:GAF domain-containing protein